MPRSKSFLVVAAIDIGTSYSGYAYSYKSDATQISVNYVLNARNAHTIKCPTSLLIDYNGHFHSFGLEAERNFADINTNYSRLDFLSNSKNPKRWRMFRQFPLQLHNNKNLSEQTTIRDHEGREYSAMDVLSMAIKYLRSRCEQDIMSKAPKLRKTDIQYIIPIPAIWDDAAKQLIKCSAIKAGLDVGRLEITYEDELAVIWCTHERGQAADLESIGSNYMVINLGDAAADISVLKRTSKSEVKEVHKISCEACGGITIVQKFIQHLENQLGKEALDEFRKKDIDSYFEMIDQFETKKHPNAFLAKYGFNLDQPYELRNSIANRKMRPKSARSHKLQINKAESNTWFEHISKLLIDQVQAILCNKNVQSVRAILLVGASAESTYIQHSIMAKLGTIPIVVPNDAGLAILKGAVLFGHVPDELNKMFLVAAAFDLGSIYSGYAFSYTHTPTNVFTNQKWCSGGTSPPLSTLKTPSCVLIDNTEKFHSFGFQAEDHFTALTRVDKSRGWRLFRNYKINFKGNKNLTRTSTVEDTQGNPYPALKIFAMAIRYLHRHLLEYLMPMSPEIHENNLRYVITVPTSWDMEAQQAMREAASEAGIDDDRLQITFEDRAAAKWCTRDGGPAPGLKTTGSKYIIIDLGGATTDITIHHKYCDTSYKVRHKVSVETWGGIAVDQRFLLHLEKTLGKKVIQNSEEYLKTSRRFESQKRAGAYSKNITVDLQLPVSYLKLNKNCCNLYIESSEVKSWFEQIVKPLLEHVKGGEEHYKDVQTIILVGGLADSKYLQDRLRDELPGISVVVPEVAGLAMLKGAVLFGHVPDRCDDMNSLVVAAFDFGTTNNRCDDMNSLVVAAFDFGTTYSGYAYSYMNEPTKVHANQNWYSSDASSKLVTLKTPTSVLLDKTGSFNSFGFEAEDKFAALAEQGKHNGWRLFRRFKMRLHTTQNLSRHSTVEDIEGKPYPAFDIITMAIQYLHNHLLKALQLALPSLLETDVQYIITVPAIWDVAAKQFMREAAIMAGIEGQRLKLALESEAAAIWCAGSNTGEQTIGRIAPGSKYIVIDLGGGTADITVFQSSADGKLRIVHKATGGAWGGTCVDQLYLEYLDEVFGDGILDELQRDHMDDYVELIRAFETKKRSKSIHSDGCIVRLPLSLLEIVRKRHTDRPASKLTDKLRIDRLKVESWFHKPISTLVEHVNALRIHPEIKDAHTILLVGGFAESVYVQEKLRNELSGISLIVPEEAGLTILKGAVLYGHNPGVVTSRVMDYTYGIDVYNNFDESIHPQEKRVFVNGKWRVANCFQVFVRVNEDIAVDHEVSHTTYPTTSKASSFPVYRTLAENPKYTTDPGCELLSTLRMKNIENVSLDDQGHIVIFMFGHSELLVKVKHKLTGEVETLTLDCLQ